MFQRRPGGRPVIPRLDGLPFSASAPNTIRPQGIGLNVIIVAPVRQRLVWWSDEELVQPVVDDDQWIVGTAGQFGPYEPPVIADGDDWIASIGVDEQYDWKARDCKPYQILLAITADEDVIPFIQPFGLDEDYWRINQYAGYIMPPTATIADEDVWVPAAKVVAKKTIYGGKLKNEYDEEEEILSMLAMIWPLISRGVIVRKPRRKKRVRNAS